MSFTAAIPVRFADIDHAGVVYFAKFFDYCHLTLEEYLRHRVGSRAYADILDRDRIGFPVRYTDCTFTAPLRFGDTVQVELAVERMGNTSISFTFRMFRQPVPDSTDPPVLCAQGKYVTTVVDLDRFQAVPIPDKLRDIFAPLVVSPTKN